MKERREKILRLVEENLAKDGNAREIRSIDSKRTALLKIEQLNQCGRVIKAEIDGSDQGDSQHTGSIPELYDSELLARSLSGLRSST